jgi:ribosomal protein S18 acetylase RimI-like enzyme
MPRLAPQIRDAVPEDAAELLDLWATATRGGVKSPRAREEAEQALANLAADPDERLLVAEVDGQVAAAMKLSRGPISPLMLDSAMHTSFLLVLPQFRRHGFAHALMDVALSWAEEKDISQVTAVTDSNRENNRFFARLGLTTVGTVRHSSVAGLRKKLTSERGHAGGNRHLVEVLAQRRSMRRRQASA